MGRAMTAGEGAPVSQAGPDASALPLAVDLDGTLLLTDTLFEAVAINLKRRPLWTLLQLLILPFAIASTKARLTRGVNLDIDYLPINADVLAYCRDARAEGRELLLVTAADQSVANQAGARFGNLFQHVVGSDGKTNNKGGAKARKLQALCPNGFEYVGDSPADMKVWRKAKAASFVGGGAARGRAIARLKIPVARRFERPKATLKVWRKALRLHQWAKNALVFIAPILAMQYDRPLVMAQCLAAWVLMGVLASGTYVLNDLLDLDADRRHHSKKKRAFAAGAIKLWQGFVAAPVLILIGVGGAAVLSLPFAIAMLAYLTTTLTYSMVLKRIPLLDAMILGFLFTLRIIMGGVLVGVPVTEWLIVLSMFLFVSLSLAKRHVEVLRKTAQGERKVANRGYVAEDAALTLGFGLATATATPMILVLYLLDERNIRGLYGNAGWLWAAPVVLSLWLMRVWLLANRGELDDDPVSFAVKDPQSLVLGAFLAACFAAAAVGLPS